MQQYYIKHCHQCDKELNARAGELYHVKDEVKIAIGVPPREFLCPECYEKRLGRRLHHSDFKPVPANFLNRKLLTEYFSDLLTPEQIDTLGNAAELYRELVCAWQRCHSEDWREVTYGRKVNYEKV